MEDTNTIEDKINFEWALSVGASKRWCLENAHFLPFGKWYVSFCYRAEKEENIIDGDKLYDMVWPVRVAHQGETISHISRDTDARIYEAKQILSHCAYEWSHAKWSILLSQKNGNNKFYTCFLSVVKEIKKTMIVSPKKCGYEWETLTKSKMHNYFRNKSIIPCYKLSTELFIYSINKRNENGIDNYVKHLLRPWKTHIKQHYFYELRTIHSTKLLDCRKGINATLFSETMLYTVFCAQQCLRPQVFSKVEWYSETNYHKFLPTILLRISSVLGIDPNIFYSKNKDIINPNYHEPNSPMILTHIKNNGSTVSISNDLFCYGYDSMAVKPTLEMQISALLKSLSPSSLQPLHIRNNKRSKKKGSNSIYTPNKSYTDIIDVLSKRDEIEKNITLWKTKESAMFTNRHNNVFSPWAFERKNASKRFYVVRTWMTVLMSQALCENNSMWKNICKYMHIETNFKKNPIHHDHRALTDICLYLSFEKKNRLTHKFMFDNITFDQSVALEMEGQTLTTLINSYFSSGLHHGITDEKTEISHNVILRDVIQFNPLFGKLLAITHIAAVVSSLYISPPLTMKHIYNANGEINKRCIADIRDIEWVDAPFVLNYGKYEIHFPMTSLGKIYCTNLALFTILSKFFGKNIFESTSCSPRSNHINMEPIKNEPSSSDEYDDSYSDSKEDSVNNDNNNIIKEIIEEKEEYYKLPFIIETRITGNYQCKWKFVYGVNGVNDNLMYIVEMLRSIDAKKGDISDEGDTTNEEMKPTLKIQSDETRMNIFYLFSTIVTVTTLYVLITEHDNDFISKSKPYMVNNDKLKILGTALEQAQISFSSNILNEQRMVETTVEIPTCISIVSSNIIIRLINICYDYNNHIDSKDWNINANKTVESQFFLCSAPIVNKWIQLVMQKYPCDYRTYICDRVISFFRLIWMYDEHIFINDENIKHEDEQNVTKKYNETIYSTKHMYKYGTHVVYTFNKTSGRIISPEIHNITKNIMKMDYPDLMQTEDNHLLLKYTKNKKRKSNDEKEGENEHEENKSIDDNDEIIFVHETKTKTKWFFDADSWVKFLSWCVKLLFNLKEEKNHENTGTSLYNQKDPPLNYKIFESVIFELLENGFLIEDKYYNDHCSDKDNDFFNRSFESVADYRIIEPTTSLIISNNSFRNILSFMFNEYDSRDNICNRYGHVCVPKHLPGTGWQHFDDNPNVCSSFLSDMLYKHSVY